MAFAREKDGNKVVAIFNLSAEAQKVAFAEPFEGYKCGLTGEQATLAQEVELAPWEYYILVK